MAKYKMSAGGIGLGSSDLEAEQKTSSSSWKPAAAGVVCTLAVVFGIPALLNEIEAAAYREDAALAEKHAPLAESVRQTIREYEAPKLKQYNFN